MTFANPYYLYLFLLLIPIVVWYIQKKRNEQATIKVPTTEVFEAMPKTWKHYLQHLPFALRVLAFAALIVILARPQSSDSMHEKNIEGIDIVMSLDISSSMLAEDLKPNRLEASKNVAAEFIMGRPNDNIGLVVFSGKSFTQCPLTTDHAALVNLLQKVDCGMIDDGTAIGNGLATAVNRIKDSQAVSKVIILLTDGSNNMGEIAPISAAEIAKTFGIRVYTIGVGTKGMAPYPFRTNFGVQYQNIKVDIDESTLQQIANLTGGLYFRATDNKKLEAIYEEIDQMEKTKIKVNEYHKKYDEFAPFAMLLFVFLLCEIILRNTILRKIP